MSQSMMSMSSLISEVSKGSGDEDQVKEADVKEIFSEFEGNVRDLSYRLFDQDIMCPDGISADKYQPGDPDDLVCQLMLDLSSFGSPVMSSSCFAILFRRAE